MPVKVKKIGNKWRVVGPDGKIEKNLKGTAVDGGGHDTEGAAQRQASAINAKMM
jgi:hypothetical protein